MLRLHVANIANGTSGRFGELSKDDISYARDPREGCLVWLRVKDDLWLAHITEADFASWRACRIEFRWEDPTLSQPETRPSPSQFSAQGDSTFALTLLDYVEFRRCTIYAVMMVDGSMGLVLPPRTLTGESHWAEQSVAMRVPETIELPRSGEKLASLLRLTFAENGIPPLIIGPRGGVFDVSGKFIARFIDRGVTASVRHEVCQPDASALGAPDLSDTEIKQLTGDGVTNLATFLRHLVSPPTTPLDIRAVALTC